MEIGERIAGLYEKDTSAAYQNLQFLEALSEREATLYLYLGEFLAMLGSERYVVRVRGFRLLCRQARWDAANRIDGSIDAVLAALRDEKPTAVRQALQALEHLAPCKPALNERIRKAVLELDYASFRDTMRPLIQKDVESLLRVLDASSR